MIKLNSKNITYVALADSANSLKAPKEIWYADSSNSVKLVYRRKDALIEGEDYEKYHWLISNSEDSQTPYIDTLIPPNLNQNIVSSFKVINSTTNGGEPGIWGAILDTSWYNCVIRCYKNTNYDYIILEYNNDKYGFPQKENMVIKTEFFEGKEYDCSLSINSSTTALGVINNESKELVANSNVNFVLNPQPTYKLFVEMNPSTWALNWSFNSVGFKKFNITNLISLVPCKLLKPVPKWLDANGIRRQVGECGMIDLISGKFYGNVNSVGTFTVENYYERKEWLVGDGTAYINTNIIYLDGVIDLVAVAEGDGIKLGRERLNSSSDHYSRFVIWIDSSNGLVYVFSSELVSAYITQPLVLQIDIQNDSLTINGQSKSLDFIPNVEANSIYLFAVNRFNNPVISSQSIVKISKFSISSKINLIPCTLTMDLPASMDANGIARTKGTSGMWDLVSDRFYGNVANSGTFKAVNLAEGVDYEVYDWLVGDGSAVINTNIEDITNLTEIYCYFYSDNPSERERIFGREGNSRIVLRYNSVNRLEFFTSYRNNPEYIILRFNTEGYFYADFVANKASTSLSSPTNFTGNSDKIGNLGTIYLFGDKVASGPTSIVSAKIKSFRAAPFMDLVPCKLLRSIPAKYDANGIARQAGECGMYDTVNDLFYGNVASSGTFSVSDDS